VTFRLRDAPGSYAGRFVFFVDLIARALGSVTTLAAGEIESECGWFAVVAGSARDDPRRVA